MGDPLLGRERVKQFTYDYSYSSVDPAKPDYVSQEKVTYYYSTVIAKEIIAVFTQHSSRFYMWKVNLQSVPELKNDLQMESGSNGFLNIIDICRVYL